MPCIISYSFSCAAQFAWDKQINEVSFLLISQESKSVCVYSRRFSQIPGGKFRSRTNFYVTRTSVCFSVTTSPCVFCRDDTRHDRLNITEQGAGAHSCSSLVSQSVCCQEKLALAGVVLELDLMKHWRGHRGFIPQNRQRWIIKTYGWTYFSSCSSPSTQAPSASA